MRALSPFKSLYPRLCLIAFSLVACQEADSSGGERGQEVTPQRADAARPPQSPDRGGDMQGPDQAPTPSGGCMVETVALSRQLESLQVGAQQRRYRLSLPSADVGQQLPILFAFQGGDGGDYPFPQQARFNALVEEEKFIMVSPIAALLPSNEGAWQLNTRDGYTQDIEFISAIIDTLSSRYCVDLERVYATGYSLGSMFAYELPCHLSERVAAIASYAGTMPVNPTACDPSNPVAIMHIHGQDDWLISYREQWDWKEWDTVGTMRAIPGLIDFWRETYRCQRADSPPSASGLHTVHSDCDGEVRVELHALQGVEHEWPAEVDGRPTAEMIWDFLKAFRRQ